MRDPANQDAISTALAQAYYDSIHGLDTGVSLPAAAEPAPENQIPDSGYTDPVYTDETYTEEYMQE